MLPLDIWLTSYILAGNHFIIYISSDTTLSFYPSLQMMFFCCSQSGFISVRGNTWCVFPPLTSAPSRTHVGDFSLHALNCVSCCHWVAVPIRLNWPRWPVLPCLHVFLLVTIGASGCDTGLVWSACGFSSVRLAHRVLPHGISLLISASSHLHTHLTEVTCKPVFYVVRWFEPRCFILSDSLESCSVSMVLEVEARISHQRGKCSPAELHPQLLKGFVFLF